MNDLIKAIQAAWNLDRNEAENVLQRFIGIFGTEGAKSHLSLNAPICAVHKITPDDYLELCAAIQRTMTISNNKSTTFILGVRNLIMATDEPQ